MNTGGRPDPFGTFAVYIKQRYGQKMKLFGLKSGENADQGLTVRSNIKYGDKHAFDVYRAGEERLPVVVHFAGAESGDRDSYAGMASYLARLGFAVVVTELPGGGAEENLTAARQLFEHLKFWGAGEKLDINSTFFSGDGTGAWTAFTAGLKVDPEDNYYIKPMGLIGFSGVYEPMELAKLDYKGARRALKYGFGIGKEGTMADGVVSLITENSPPVFFAHSDGDGLSYAETMLLKTALRRNGVVYSEFRAAFRRAKFDFYKKAASPEGAAALRAAARFMTAVTDKTEFSGEYTEI